MSDRSPNWSRFNTSAFRLKRRRRATQRFTSHFITDRMHLFYHSTAHPKSKNPAAEQSGWFCLSSASSICYSLSPLLKKLHFTSFFVSLNSHFENVCAACLFSAKPDISFFSAVKTTHLNFVCLKWQTKSLCFINEKKIQSETLAAETAEWCLFSPLIHFTCMKINHNIHDMF